MKVRRQNELELDCVFSFEADTIEIAPDAPGVFAFFNEHGHVLRIGSAVTSVRAMLIDHYKGYEGGTTCGAAYVGFESSRNPLELEADLRAKLKIIRSRKPKTA